MPIRETLVSRCSLAIAPVDLWTGRTPPGSELSVALEGVYAKPLRRPDGIYIYLDLPPARYRLTVSSARYMPHAEDIDTASLDPLSPEVTVPLLPGRGYAPPGAATGIVFRVTDGEGRPVPGAEVEAYADGEPVSRGRISQDEAPAGSAALRIASPQGRLVPGDALLLQGRDGRKELIRVAGQLPGGELRLTAPLQSDWRRGASLLPAVRTVSGPDGTVVLPLRGPLPAAFPVRAVIRAHGRTAAGEWTAAAGSVMAVPAIVL